MSISMVRAKCTTVLQVPADVLRTTKEGAKKGKKVITLGDQHFQCGQNANQGSFPPMSMYEGPEGAKHFQKRSPWAISISRVG